MKVAESDEQSRPVGAVRLEIMASHSPSDDTRAGSVWTTTATMLGLLGKLLPGAALLVAILIYHSEVSDFLRNASKVEVFGVKLEKQTFATRLQESAKSSLLPTNNPAWTEVPFRKLKLAGPAMVGLQILWVDDHPENNFYLRRILEDTGAHVTIKISNAEALDAARRNDYGIVISDFGRDPPLKETGGTLSADLAAIGYGIPFIFYTSDPDRIPEGIPRDLATNDPSQLLSEIAELAIARQ